MASKKQVTTKLTRAARSKPLNGFKIVICGEYKDENHTHTSLAVLICANGGDTTKHIKSDTTHIFSTQAAFRSSQLIIEKAKGKGLPIIDTLWLIKAQCERTELSKYYLQRPSPKPYGTIEDSRNGKFERKLPLRAKGKEPEHSKPKDDHGLKEYRHTRGTSFKAVVKHNPKGILKGPDFVTPPEAKTRRHDIVKRVQNKKVGFVKNEKLFLAPPESTLPEPVKKLMKLIFNQTNGANATDGHRKNSTCYESHVSRLSLDWQKDLNLQAGFKYLIELEDFISNGDKKAIGYYNTLYHSVIRPEGRGKGPLIDNMKILKEEWERLSNVVHLPKRQFQDLNLKEMAPLDDDSEEFKYIKSYLNVSGGATHELKKVFRIEREGEGERFQAYISPLEHPIRRLLWHGSPVANYGRIIREGLQIGPDEVTASDYNFGKGICLFEMSSQAASYCDYKASEGEALLLLCEAALGYPLKKVTTPSNSAGANTETDSTCCQGKNAFKRFTEGSNKHVNFEGIKIPDTNFGPKPTKVQEAILDYNVFICHKAEQVKLRYLVHVKIPTQAPT
ncbi:Poly [ADP-ribose] polymerase 1 [Fusarium oxysporum f. sp. rapae]|uniref:Poly [ADP-ribose] polymerase n=1 Tax=Fusarium oxysporum f. sp. rapae TaxID=485398 RepID=A0A8J5NML3_FUSOX|nr:Poly [ADP-ribose] polymerase 1 [Fusarium oxysporum f. sp. rapae]